MQRYETFGEVLSRFMRDRNCSMKELAGRMGIKSANTIARITADKSSFRKIQTFCGELLEKNPLQLVKAEKEELREAVAVSARGVESYAAGRQIWNFVRERIPGPDCVCRQAFGEGSLFIISLEDLFLSYRELARVDIMIQNCAISGVTRALKAFLEQQEGLEVNIEHYITSCEESTRQIDDFTSLLDVMGHPDYHFFFSSVYGSTERSINVYNHIIVALKQDRQGNRWTDIVRFHAEDSFDLLYNVEGEASYQFNFQQFHALRIQHNPASTIYDSDFSLHGMTEYNRRLLELDRRNSSLTIRPDICLAMVPPDIIEAATKPARKDLSKESAALYAQYLQAAGRRYQVFCSQGKRRRYLFSKAGICSFFKYGRSGDAELGIRNWTMEERRRILEGIIRVAATVPTTTIHLLKNELHYNNVSYLLYGDKVLLIDNYERFSNFDPAKRCHSCCVQSPAITGSFSYFAEHELLEKYTYSNEETTAFLEELLQT